MDAPKSDLEPWQWPEEHWRKLVARVRAGRSLRPAAWPGGARCAVALSFDSDHETIPLRDGEIGPGKLSQGEFGARVGARRILALLADPAVEIVDIANGTLAELKQLLPPAKVEYVEKQPSLEDIFLALVGNDGKVQEGKDES